MMLQRLTPSDSMETLTELIKKGEIKTGEMVTVEVEGLTMLEGVLTTDSQQNAVIRQNTTVYASPTAFLKQAQGNVRSKDKTELNLRHLRVGGRTATDLHMLNSITPPSTSPVTPRKLSGSQGQPNKPSTPPPYGQYTLISSDSSSKLSLPSSTSSSAPSTVTNNNSNSGGNNNVNGGFVISPSVIRQTNFNNSRNHSRNHSRNSSVSSNVKTKNYVYTQYEIVEDRDEILIKIKGKFDRLTEDNKKKQEKIKDLENTNADLEQEKEQLSKRNNSLKSQYEQSQETIADRDDEIEKLRKEKEALLASENKSSDNETVQNLQKLLLERDKALQQMEEEMEDKEQERKKLRNEVRKLHQEREEIGVEKDEFLQEKGQYRKSVEIKDYFLREKMNEIIQLKLDMNRSKVGWEKEISTRDSRILYLETQLNDIQATLEQEQSLHRTAQTDLAERNDTIQELRDELSNYKSTGRSGSLRKKEDSTKFGSLTKRSLQRERSVNDKSPNTSSSSLIQSPSANISKSPNSLPRSASSNQNGIARAPSNSANLNIYSMASSSSSPAVVIDHGEGPSALVNVDSYVSVASATHTEPSSFDSPPRKRKGKDITSPSNRSFKERLRIFAGLSSSPEKKERAAMRKAKSSSSDRSPNPPRFQKSASTPDASSTVEIIDNKTSKRRASRVSVLLKKFQPPPQS